MTVSQQSSLRVARLPLIGVAIALVAALMMGFSGPATAFAAAPASCPASISTGGGTCVSGPVRLSAQQQAILAIKTQLAQEYAGVRTGRVTYAQYQRDLSGFLACYAGSTHPVRSVQPFCTIDPHNGQCISGQVSLTQQPQQTTYYCGPATASEVLGVRGVNDSQKTLAGNAYLATDANGQTSWNPSVMAPTLDTLTRSSYYIPVNGSVVGGGFSESTWITDLEADVNQGWALSGNIVEYANTDPHLNGHPRNMTIYHWIGIYGYSSYGNNTSYADSVSGTRGLFSWAGSVPAYSQLSSGSMTTLLNQRGYVW